MKRSVIAGLIIAAFAAGSLVGCNDESAKAEDSNGVPVFSIVAQTENCNIYAGKAASGFDDDAVFVTESKTGGNGWGCMISVRD